jgi:23S rRNA (cytidine1920-2'-O)/16S rRNA (cytidine1409-2'-O)-methyltransferase
MGPMSGKSRLDLALVERGLAPTRAQARDLVKRGCVRVDGAAATKAGFAVGPEAAVEVDDGAQPYVSRGGLKLAAALAAFGFEARGLTALDIGASTGGFTHVLLDQGARRVYAVDVGRGQLHPRIAGDARVAVLEGQDVRALDISMIPEPPQAIVADVSFISLTQALPAAMALAAPGAWLIALLKPQFEAGRAEIGKGGVVRNEAARLRAVEKVRTWLAGVPGWRVVGVVPSPITGGSGNAEFLIGARRDD